MIPPFCNTSSIDRPNAVFKFGSRNICGRCVDPVFTGYWSKAIASITVGQPVKCCIAVNPFGLPTGISSCNTTISVAKGFSLISACAQTRRRIISGYPEISGSDILVFQFSRMEFNSPVTLRFFHVSK